jgi:hypothetical protein
VFPSVGLYACPGETLKSGCQLEWFRDVIFDAAKQSGKHPVIVIRDWTLNHDFSAQLKGQPVASSLTPDRVIRLLNELACEALVIAEEAVKAAAPPHKAELGRFVTDSRIFKLATEALTAKEDAAILKACMLQKKEYDKAEVEAFIEKMKASVHFYQQLHDLGQSCYTKASFRITWTTDSRSSRPIWTGSEPGLRAGSKVIGDSIFARYDIGPRMRFGVK